VLKRNILISLMILFVGLLAGFLILTYKPSQAAPEGHGEAAPAAPASPRGPHTGRLFTDKDLSVEVQIYETEIPPEFHVWFWREGKPVPLDEVKFSTKIYRLGKTDVITYKREKDYLLSEQTIYEPHSFKAVFQGEYQGRHYEWSFTQEEGRLTIPPDLLKRSDIKILKAGPQSLGTKLSFPGEIAMDQDSFVHLVPPLAGVAVQVHKHVGERVAQGEVLATIQSRELTDLRLARSLLQQKSERARFLLGREETLDRNIRRLLNLLRQGQDPESIHAQLIKTPIGDNKTVLLTAFADLRLAQQTFRREEQLAKDKVSSQEALQTAHTTYDNALSRYIGSIEEALWQRENGVVLRRQDVQAVDAELRAQTQRLQSLNLTGATTALGRYDLRSPISGVVTKKHLAIGEAITPDREIFEIANLNEVWAELQVPDAQLSQVRLGQKVRVLSQNGQRLAFGTISHSSPVVDPETRRAEAHAHIANLDGFWRPGMFVTIEVVTEARSVPIAVAKTALQAYNDWTVVYAKFGDTYEIRPLELGQESDEWVEVLDGIPAGQAYAATNSFIIKAEIGKKAATHDH
jgi:cobalt-zinc-cadmium efflux system membrane fusion protein